MNKVQIGVGEGWLLFGARDQFTDMQAVVGSLEREGFQVFVGSWGVYVRKPGYGVYEPAQLTPAYIDILEST